MLYLCMLFYSFEYGSTNDVLLLLTSNISIYVYIEMSRILKVAQIAVATDQKQVA